MRFAVFTVSLPEWTPDEAAVQLAALGYDGIEWRVTDQAPARRRTRLLVGQPLHVAAEHACSPTRRASVRSVRAPGSRSPISVPMSCLEPDAVGRGNGRCCRDRRTVDPRAGPALRRERTVRRTARRGPARVRRRRRPRRGHGVRALVETHMQTILPSASAAYAFCTGFDPAHIGVIHDAGNMVYEGFEHYRMGLEVLGPYLAHVHLKNARWVTAGTRRTAAPDGSPSSPRSPRAASTCARCSRRSRRSATTAGCRSRTSRPNASAVRAHP